MSEPKASVSRSNRLEGAPMSDDVAERLDRAWAAANLVTLFRLALAAALLALAWIGWPGVFAIALAVALATDLLDGQLARAQPPRRSARLASWAHLATYAGLPLCAYWLRPDLIHSEAVAFWSVVVALAAPAVHGFIKYGALARLPTRAAVVAGYAIGGAAILLFAGGPTWPLRVAAAALAAAALEEMAITALLPRPMSAVRTLPAALKLRREQFVDDDE
jgi:cardiolipin synthase